MSIQRCKGCSDLLPEEMAKFRLIEDTFRELCLKWGYNEVRTPTLEYLHLFTSTGTLTPEMLGRVYSFLDWDGWSGERMVLRPDGTIPAARLYIENLEGKGTARLFYVTNVFVFEATGREKREKWQCGVELLGSDSKLADVELLGSDSKLADVELVSLSLEALKKLGLKNIELKLSHAGVIRAILKRAGLSPDEETKLFDDILDGKKVALDRLKFDAAEMRQGIQLLFELKGKSSGFLKNLSAIFGNGTPEVKTALQDFISVCDSLTSLGIEYEIDIGSGRGFEYYTGIMFQILSGREKIGGGGRYDALIPLMGGNDTPASGFALYIDKLMNFVTMEEKKMPLVLVKTRPDILKRAFEAANRLRDEGYRAEFFTSGAKPEDACWVLHLKDAGGFMLTDRDMNKKIDFTSLDETLRYLGEAGKKP